MQAEKIYALSEILISGVPLFLFVSGCLAARRNIDSTCKWWFGKAKRVLLPLMLFVTIIYGVYEIAGVVEITPFQWIFTLCNLQGLNYTYWKFGYFGAVPGCGHLWFITTLMFCYLLVPLAQIIKNKNVSLSKLAKFALVFGVLGIQLGLMYLGFQLSYIITFFFGYFLSGSENQSNSPRFAFVTIATVLICGARLALKKFIDGSDFYDRYFALISAAFIAVWLFYFVRFLRDKFPRLIKAMNNPVIIFTERISFYFYLTHYIFLTGPAMVFGYIENRLLAHLAAFVLSYVSATAFCLIVEKGLLKILDRRKT